MLWTWPSVGWKSGWKSGQMGGQAEKPMSGHTEESPAEVPACQAFLFNSALPPSPGTVFGPGSQ